jgi:hypothetical protein
MLGANGFFVAHGMVLAPSTARCGGCRTGGLLRDSLQTRSSEVRIGLLDVIARNAQLAADDDGGDGRCAEQAANSHTAARREGFRAHDSLFWAIPMTNPTLPEAWPAGRADRRAHKKSKAAACASDLICRRDSSSACGGQLDR